MHNKIPPHWRNDAVCRNSNDPEAWFPQPTAALSILDVKESCFGCPVMYACAQYALTTEQEHGVWGGLSEQQRKEIRKRHKTPALTDPDLCADVVAAAQFRDLNPIRSLRDLWDLHHTPLPGGHMAWQGGNKSVEFNGVKLTPNQLAFWVDRGDRAVGIVRRTPDCDVAECIHPRHLEDTDERKARQAREAAAKRAA